MIDTIARITKWAMYLCLAVWGLTFLLINRLPENTEIDSLLFQEPLQEETGAEPFTIEYLGQKNEVKPKAEYEVWGLVVSHNDPLVWYRFDITHDKISLNTRDVCLLWGDNLKSNDFHHVNIRNDDTNCHYFYEGSLKFSSNELSNNHLITSQEALRNTIAHLLPGDQIHIKGKLVDYTEKRWNGIWRHTSINRFDKGTGSGEIIFAETIEILHSKNKLWGILHHMSLYAAIFFFLVRFILFFFTPTPFKKKKRDSY